MVRNIGISKIIGLMTFIFVICISIMYYNFYTLKSYLNEYKNSNYEYVVGSYLDSYFSKFGEFPIKTDQDFKKLKHELNKKYNLNGNFEFEKYLNHMQIDTVDNIYRFYSYGPNDKNDSLRVTPFNNRELSTWNFNQKKVSFLEYLAMPRDYDILLMERKLNYNCFKHLLDVPAILTSKTSERENHEISTMFYRKIDSINNSKSFLENIPSNSKDIIRLIFTYDGNSVKCICPSGLNMRDVEILQEGIFKKLENFGVIEKVTFPFFLPPAG